MSTEFESLPAAIQRRGISEVVHFTTNRGFTGTMQLGKLVSRHRLSNQAYLKEVEKILHTNCYSRKRDERFLDYVNLSVSRVNGRFFKNSRGRHRQSDVFWQVLSLKPEIMCHPGVLFTTTNNIYTGCKRQAGRDGFEAMFDNIITQWAGRTITRPDGEVDHHTTCFQAEVLYPGEIDPSMIQRVYVANDLCRAETLAMIDSGKYPRVPIEVRPDIFGE